MKAHTEKDPAKAAWSSPYGQRYNCWKCGTKFYTLGRKQAICPNCESNQAEAPLLSEKVPSRASKASKLEVPPIEEEILDIIDEETVETELDESVEVAEVDDEDADKDEEEEA